MRRDIWAFVSSATFVTGQMSLHYLLSFKKVSLYFIREQMRSKEGEIVTVLLIRMHCLLWQKKKTFWGLSFISDYTKLYFFE